MAGSLEINYEFIVMMLKSYSFLIFCPLNWSGIIPLISPQTPPIPSILITGNFHKIACDYYTK